LTKQSEVSSVMKCMSGKHSRIMVMASLGNSSIGVERVIIGTADPSDFGAAEASAPEAISPLAALGEVTDSVANCVIGSHVILPVSSGGVSVVT
jgi:hypothetical protein